MGLGERFDHSIKEESKAPKQGDWEGTRRKRKKRTRQMLRRKEVPTAGIGQ